ncbi:uncharacterized protein C11orf87 homolog isoform X3 [Taeniopygia guttata]|uniref:uncharacterized protein C11orf87 homolog isoform X3 n=1 Tax=Taeniopygia guttata TaxID=59729 RepID=UPI003BB99BDC
MAVTISCRARNQLQLLGCFLGVMIKLADVLVQEMDLVSSFTEKAPRTPNRSRLGPAPQPKDIVIAAIKSHHWIHRYLLTGTYRPLEI